MDTVHVFADEVVKLGAITHWVLQHLPRRRRVAPAPVGKVAGEARADGEELTTRPLRPRAADPRRLRPFGEVQAIEASDAAPYFNDQRWQTLKVITTLPASTRARVAGVILDLPPAAQPALPGRDDGAPPLGRPRAHVGRPLPGGGGAGGPGTDARDPVVSGPGRPGASITPPASGITSAGPGAVCDFLSGTAAAARPTVTRCSLKRLRSDRRLERGFLNQLAPARVQYPLRPFAPAFSVYFARQFPDARVCAECTQIMHFEGPLSSLVLFSPIWCLCIAQFPPGISSAQLAAADGATRSTADFDLFPPDLCRPARRFAGCNAMARPWRAAGRRFGRRAGRRARGRSSGRSIWRSYHLDCHRAALMSRLLCFPPVVTGIDHRDHRHQPDAGRHRLAMGGLAPTAQSGDAPSWWR